MWGAQPQLRGHGAICRAAGLPAGRGSRGLCWGLCSPSTSHPFPRVCCLYPALGGDGQAGTGVGASVPEVPRTQTGLVPLCQHRCQCGDQGLGARESPTAARPVWDCPIPAGQGWVLGAEPSWGGCGALGIPEDEQQLNSSRGTTTAGGTGRGAARKGNFSMGRKGLGPSFGCEGRENKAQSH